MLIIIDGVLNSVVVTACMMHTTTTVGHTSTDTLGLQCMQLASITASINNTLHSVSWFVQQQALCRYVQQFACTFSFSCKLLLNKSCCIMKVFKLFISVFLALRCIALQQQQHAWHHTTWSSPHIRSYVHSNVAVPVGRGSGKDLY